MRVASWNVNGVRKREPQLLAWIADEQPDVICLQETKASLHQVPTTLANHPGYHARWHGDGGYSGVALLLARATFPEPPVFGHPPFDFETRIVTAEVGGDIVFASMYGPNGGKDFVAKMTFLVALERWAGELEAAGKHLVLCGDFNVARTDRDVHPMLQKPMIGQSPEERALIEQLFAHGLVDVGRLVDPDNDRLFSWWAPWRDMRPKNIGWRLDYVAAAHALVDETVACQVFRMVGTSDHGPVIATLRDTPLPIDQ
ncbi:MAG: exodeoxyribonuclease III [Proteobacteria bacterium]|nr:exodeoxyribonuclease III [Pseudomonadota bacterium]